MDKRINEPLPPEVLAEAKELTRGAEVLPDGTEGLARRIMEARKENRVLRVKLGVDPTGSSLHLGHSVVLRCLRRFQDRGHQAVLIIGGFTAQIGDPSGRNSARPQLSAEEVAANASTFLSQVEHILDLTKTEVRNNADWLNPAVLWQLATQVTVNQLLAKEGFAERLKKQEPVGLHELFYPLLQGFDSVEVNADIEIGGTDQRFNVLQGRDQQSRLGKLPQMALLMPILEGTDGTRKMSKTFGNAIGLKDHADDMFAKCMRLPDALIVKFFELSTSVGDEELARIKAELEGGANPKDLKERLATQVVLEQHGRNAADAALAEWRHVHSQRQIPTTMPSHVVPEPIELRRLLVATWLSTSLSQARNDVTAGAVSIDGAKMDNATTLVAVPPAGGTVLRRGRKFIRLVPAA
ncbi:MAG TPA: tyrosine--tRNA ligase [Planktothrix sp.]|jgi:tyrosyl-tRNA synthetase